MVYKYKDGGNSQHYITNSNIDKAIMPGNFVFLFFLSRAGNIVSGICAGNIGSGICAGNIVSFSSISCDEQLKK